jgi:hypothetical protein
LKNTTIRERKSAIREHGSAIRERKSAIRECKSAIRERKSAIRERKSAIRERKSAIPAGEIPFIPIIVIASCPVTIDDDKYSSQQTVRNLPADHIW